MKGQHFDRARRLLRYARPYRRGWLTIALLSLAAGGIGLLQPWPMKIVIDQVLGGEEPGGLVARLIHVLPGATSTNGLLGWIALATVGLGFAACLLEFRMAMDWLRVGQRTVYDMARDLFARIQQRSLAFHSRGSVGELMGRVTTDSFCIYRIVDTMLIGPPKSILLASAMTVIMARMNWQMTVFALMTAPLMGVAVLVLGKKVRSASRARREIDSRIQAYVRQSLAGVQVIQAFGQEGREHDRFHDHANAAVRAHRRTALLTNVADLWTGLVIAVGNGIILYAGSRFVAGASLSVGGLLVFVSYLTIFQKHFQNLARAFTTLQSLRGEIDRVTEILDQPPEVRNSPTAIPLPRVQGRIQLENVWFGYEPDRPVLRGIDATLNPGETVAIVGATGAGKTTLTSLLPRLHDPQKGRILLDGLDLREVDLSDLRRSVGIVFQDPHLIPATVRDNIAYGAPGAPLDRVIAAAEAANADAFIRGLPEGYETLLGERGMTLSGGQRQRLSIARAFLKDAPILILDEPTSALDAHAEQLLVDALRRLVRGRTTLIIAHRLSTIRHADRILVLDAGTLLEQGTHEELLAAGGAYARLHQAQSGPSAIGGSEP